MMHFRLNGRGFGHLACTGLLLLACFATVPGCSDDSPGPTATGGKPATGGVQTGTGGSPSTGGAPATGGVTATGGASTGGVATGGIRATGGVINTGGVATGGLTNTGGASTGGAPVTGGINGQGGAPATGGTAAGGTPVTGGALGGTGGTPATGGVKVDAGSPDTTVPTPDGGTGYNPCPTTAGTACAVLPRGDSITEGCCTAPMGGYRIELFNQAVKDGKNLTFVGSASNGPDTVAGKTFPKKHEGHGGYTIDTGTGHSGISGSITNSALTNYKPNIVLLMIGTNDINGNIDVTNAPTRLGKLIDDITTGAPSALVVVASIIPSTTDGVTTKFQTYNAAIPGVIATRAQAGKHVVFVDNFKVFSANANFKTAWMSDYLHPNTAGYVALGQSFYGVIGSYLR